MIKILSNLMLLFLFCISVSAQEQDIAIIDAVERMPAFPGGEQKMYEYIKEKLAYTRSALDAEAEGRVTVRFIVRRTGAVENMEVLRGIHPDCDSVAIDIVKSMPDWTPGSQNGKGVDIWFTLPVIFKLEGFLYEMVGKKRVYKLPQQSASYPGGEQAMFKFINENLKYPSMEPCFQGRVTVHFIVTKEGKIVKPVIIKGITSAADKEALRVINLMPDWIPGKHKGELVDVYYTIPIVFRLR